MDNLSELLPIIIFILWLIFGRGKKKAETRPKAPPRAQAPKAESTGVRSSPGAQPRPPVAKKSEAPGAVLRKTLEDFLEEMGTVIREDLPGSEPSPPQTRTHSQADVNHSHTRREWVESGAPGGRGEGTSLEKAWEPAPTQEGISGKSSLKATSGPFESYISSSVVGVGEPTVSPPRSAEELRKAIVWSELIGPPVALRHDEPSR